ncbi:orotidine 5'-phosphate decarboxylase [Bryobacterales bacterium F-183]|nr:orotidine 5'-phosphate decarboxylase [Bryobacterales bacterium F-183]
MSQNPIIIALDVETAAEARALVHQIGDSCRFYKVGLELFSASGPELVRELLEGGNRIFLDLKMYDIGETVKRAVRQVGKLGVDFLTVHAVPQVMRAAVEGASGTSLKILGVTVLTSFDQADLEAMGHHSTVAELVSLRVGQALACGVQGVVCSPQEVAEVRRATGPDFQLVTPGVRSAGAAAGDQKRVATPAAAMRDGASFLVIGRQVTRAHDPAGEVRRILSELSFDSVL